MMHDISEQPFSPFYWNRENADSVIKRSYQEILFDKTPLQPYYLPDHLDLIVWNELYHQWRLELIKIVDNIYGHLELDCALSEHAIFFVDIVSPFATFLGVDSNNCGWNILGRKYTRINEIPYQKTTLFRVIRKLYNVYRSTYSIENFRGMTVPDIDVKLDHMSEDNVEETFVHECYTHEVQYPGTLIHYMDMRLAMKTKIWFDETVFKRIYHDIFRKTNIVYYPSNPKNLNLLQEYNRGKIRLSHTSNQLLEGCRNHQKTIFQCKHESEFKPCFLSSKHARYVTSTHFMHPSFPRKFIMEQKSFSSILEYIHFKMCSFYQGSVFSYYNRLMSTWDTWVSIVSLSFRNHFDTFYHSQLESMDCRLAFLEWNENDSLVVLPEPIFGLTNDTVFQRLVSMKQEMTRYLPSEHSVEVERMLSLLNQCLRWFTFTNPNCETDVIRAFFEGLCDQSHQEPIETDITYPMNLESHGLLHAYIVNYKFREILSLSYDRLASILKQYIFSNPTLFQQLCSKMHLFQKMFQNLQEVQVVTVENLPFLENQTILNPLQYSAFQRMFFDDTKIDK